MTEGRHRIKTEDSEMRQLVSDNEFAGRMYVLLMAVGL